MKSDNSFVVRSLASSLCVLLIACAGARATDGTGPHTQDGGYIPVKDSSWEYIPQYSADSRPQRCDDAGNCHCMNILSIGQVAHYGGNKDSTDAFQAWLNSKSSATVTILSTRTPITRELLSNYDVLILQALEDNEYTGFWSFTADEVKAVADWVQEGNGLISLTGYGAVADEVNGTNQLLAFAGLSYAKSPDTFVNCPDNMCYCHDNSVAFNSWETGSWIGYSMLNASNGVAGVGVFHGRPILCDSNVGGACDIVASDAKEGIVGAGKIVGKGRVFAWSDEWVTYTTQWGAPSQPQGQQCNDYLASAIFNCPQFWYNVIHWALPDAACFNITDPQVIP